MNLFNNYEPYLVIFYNVCFVYFSSYSLADIDFHTYPNEMASQKK